MKSSWTFVASSTANVKKLGVWNGWGAEVNLLFVGVRARPGHAEPRTDELQSWSRAHEHQWSSSLFLCWIIPQLLLGSSWAHTSGDDLFIARKMRLLPRRVQTQATFQHPPLDQGMEEDLSQLLILIYIAAAPLVVCFMASYILLQVMNYFGVELKYLFYPS